MPDFLPVGLQDILYRRQPELRKGEITLQFGAGQADNKDFVSSDWVDVAAYCMRRGA